MAQDEANNPKTEFGWSVAGYAILSFASLAVALFVGYYLLTNVQRFQSQTLAQGFYVLLLVLGLSAAAFLFGAMRSTARITGTHWGFAVDVGGPAAMAVLVVIGGFILTKQPDEFDLTIFLRDDGTAKTEDVAKDAKLRTNLGNRPVEQDFAKNGELTIKEIPSSYRGQYLTITFESPTYRLESKSNKYKVPDKGPLIIHVVLDKKKIGEQEKKVRSQKLLEPLRAIAIKLNENTQEKSTLDDKMNLYKQNPSDNSWKAVQTEARKLAEETAKGIKLAVEFDSQFVEMGDEIYSITENTFVLSEKKFIHQVRVVKNRWNAALRKNEEIVTYKKAKALPTDEEVEAWRNDLMTIYAELSKQLLAFCEKFGASAGVK